MNERSRWFWVFRVNDSVRAGSSFSKRQVTNFSRLPDSRFSCERADEDLPTLIRQGGGGGGGPFPDTEHFPLVKFILCFWSEVY